MEHAGDRLTTQLIVTPTKQGPVVHLSLGPVAGDADGPVHDDVLRGDGGDLGRGVELPAVGKIISKYLLYR